MALGVRKRRDGTVVAGRWDPVRSTVVDGDYPETHHFPSKWVAQGLVDGLVSVTGGRIILHVSSGDVAYRIIRHPGAYCTGCGDRVGDGPARSAAEVAARTELLCGEDAGAVEVIDFYDTQLEEAPDG